MSDIDDRLDRLESLVEQQQQTINEQQVTIEQQRERIAELEDDEDGDVIMNRRTALQAGGILGLIGVGAGAASADAQGSVGTDSNPLNTLYAEELNGGVTNDQSLTDLEGSGLSISSGTLNASGTSAWTDGDAADLLEPSDGTKAGIEVDRITDNGSGDVTLGNTLNLDSNEITNVGTVNGISISTHASRHLPSGPDSLATGSPVTLGTSNDEGTADAFARADHVHAHGALGGETTNGRPHHSLATTSTPGFLSSGDKSKLNNLASDANSTYVNSVGDTMTGSLVLDGDSLSLLNGASIADAGTDAITFDGNQNVTIPNGNLNLNGNKLTNASAINGGVTGNTEITDIVGSGLTINSNTLETTGNGLWTDSGDDGLLNPADSGDNGIGVTNVQTDNLTDNGSGDVTMGTSLDMAGNNIRLTEDYELDMQPGLDTVEFRDTNNNHTTLRIGTGDPGVVSLMNANLRVRNSSSITDNFGDAFLTINSGGPLGVGKTLDLNSNNITNVSEITATTASVGTLDNDGSAIGVADPLDLSASASIQDAGTDAVTFDGSQNVTVPNGDLTVSPSTDSTTTLDVQNTNGNSVLSADSSTHKLRVFDYDASDSVVVSHDGGEGRISTTVGGLGLNLANGKLVGKGDSDLVIEKPTEANLADDTKTLKLDAIENEDAGTTGGSGDTANIELNAGRTNGSVQVTNGNFDVQTGTVENTTGDLTLGSTNGSVQVTNGNFDVQTGTVENTTGDLTLRSTTGSVQVTDGNLDVQTGTVENTTGSLTVTTNDLGDLTLDPGSNNDIQVPNGDIDMNNNGSVINESDARLKTAIEPIGDATAKVAALEARTYEWKDDDVAGRDAGVIAQSVEEVLPEAVKEDEDGTLKLAYRQLTPLVIAAVQEQQETIDDLEAENERLRERNAELEDRLAAVEAELGIDAPASQQGVADD